MELTHFRAGKEEQLDWHKPGTNWGASSLASSCSSESSEVWIEEQKGALFATSPPPQNGSRPQYQFSGGGHLRECVPGRAGKNRRSSLSICQLPTRCFLLTMSRREMELRRSWSLTLFGKMGRLLLSTSLFSMIIRFFLRSNVSVFSVRGT